MTASRSNTNSGTDNSTIQHYVRSSAELTGQQTSHTCDGDCEGHSNSEAKHHQFLQIMIPDPQSYQGLACPSTCKRLLSSSTFVNRQPVMIMTHDTTEPFHALHPIHLSKCLVVKRRRNRCSLSSCRDLLGCLVGAASDSDELQCNSRCSRSAQSAG